MRTREDEGGGDRERVRKDHRVIDYKMSMGRTLETPVPKDAERHWDVNLILFWRQGPRGLGLHGGTPRVLCPPVAPCSGQVKVTEL